MPARSPAITGRERDGATDVGNLAIARSARGAAGAAFVGAPIGNLQHQGRARVQPKCATCDGEARRRGAPATCSKCAGQAAAQPLEISEPGDALELEADAIASSITGAQRPTPTGTSVQRAPAERGAAAAPSADVARPDAMPGQPLDASTRAELEPQLGADLSDVRIHTGPSAARAARSIDARAYTLANHVVFDEHEFRPHEASGRHLLAHELVHVVQQRGASDGAARVQRDPTPGAPAPGSAPPAVDPQQAADASAQKADTAAHDAGPCGVDASALSNQGLLIQLNRARLYLTQHTWGEDQTYDHNNLLVRLAAERRRRINAGHVWLAEPGLIAPPGELFSLEPGDGLSMTVRSVAGAAAAGGFVPLGGTLLTRGQFTSFLARRNLPTVEMSRILESVFGGGEPGAATSVTLPPETRAVASAAPLEPNASFDPLGAGASTAGAGGGPSLLPPQFYMPLGPEASQLQSLLAAPPQNETVGAAGQIGEARDLPGAISSGGPERVFAPRPAQPALAQIIAVDQLGNQQVLGIVDLASLDPAQRGGTGPTALSSLGFLSRPAPLGPNQGGLMWEGHHASQTAMLQDRLMTTGFRAGFPLHFWSTLTGRDSAANAKLNVGVPGSLKNDAMYPAAGELWGNVPSKHWGSGSMAIVRADGSELAPGELAAVMLEAQAKLAGVEYRFSPTMKPGSQAFKNADALAKKLGKPGFDPSQGAQMCINPPCTVGPEQTPLNERMIGQKLTYTNQQGVAIDLSRADQSSAAAMSEYMNLPEEFWAARGLRKINLGARVWGSYAGGVGLGVGMSLLSDAMRAGNGEHPAWARDAAMSGGSNLVSAMAEDYAFTGATAWAAPKIAAAAPELSQAAVAARAGIAGRFMAGTGVAIIVAPLVTAGQMALDDEHYTSIDYLARSGRSAVAAGGGALATIGTAMLIGSGAGPAGTIVGFIVGAGAYALTDLVVGDYVEDGIRELGGEHGCTGGVGPKR